jgi:hypothetical protein
MKASCAVAFEYRIAAQPGFMQLSDGDRAVLTPGNLGHQLVSGAFVMHIGTKSPGVADSPPLPMAAPGRRSSLRGILGRR